MKKTISYYLLLLGQYIFLVLFSFLVLQVIFSMKIMNINVVNISTARMAIYTIVLIGMLKCYIIWIRRKKQCYKKAIFISICFVWFIIQGLYIYSTYSQTDSDAYVVNCLAWDLTHNIEIESFSWEYFARYQNNIPLLFLYTICYKVIGGLFSFEESWIVLAVAAALFADLAIYWTVQLSNVVCKRNENLIFPLLCGILLIGLSEEGSIFYTDIVSLWLIPCSLYFLVLAFDKKKSPLRNIVISGAILGIGGTFKPQVFIVAIAVLIVYGLAFIHYKLVHSFNFSIKNLLIFLLLIFITYFVFSNICTTWYISVLPEQYNGRTYLEEQKYPSLHWINMGLNYSTYGAYSPDDVMFTGSISGIDAKNAALLESIQHRLQELSISDLFAYENKKVVLTIQNGSFSQEMTWKGILLNNSSLALKLQPYFVSIYDEWKNGIGIIIQILYILIIILCLYVIYKYLRTHNLLEYLLIQSMSVSLIGVICFIVLLEQNIRYFYSMIPILIVLSSKGIEFIISNNRFAKDANNLL